MKKNVLIILVSVFVIACSLWYLVERSMPKESATRVTFFVENKPVVLINGRAESEAASGSATTVVTQYFGNAAAGDLSGDNIPDTAFLITQSSGGSGTFYYVVAVVSVESGYEGTNAILLGDRVAPQSTEIRSGTVVVNYADRPLGAPMSTAPSVGKTLRLTLDSATMKLVEIKN